MTTLEKARRFTREIVVPLDSGAPSFDIETIEQALPDWNKTTRETRGVPRRYIGDESPCLNYETIFSREFDNGTVNLTIIRNNRDEAVDVKLDLEEKYSHSWLEFKIFNADSLRTMPFFGEASFSRRNANDEHLSEYVTVHNDGHASAHKGDISLNFRPPPTSQWL